MRDVSDQAKSLRVATAQAILKVSPDAIMSVREQQIPMGDPLTMAKVAGIQAAKQCSGLIPYCQPLIIDFIGIDFQLHDDFIEVKSTVKAVARSGIEMEALTAVSVAALTLYDLLKALDETLEISSVRLLSKKGGHSELKAIHEQVRSTLRTAVLVISDSIAGGRKVDVSGKLVVERLLHEGISVSDYQIVPDDASRIQAILLTLIDERRMDLVFTIGGVGLGPRDNTPEVMQNIIEREMPGISEAMRTYAQERTPYAMLSRGIAGIRGKTLVVNLPGTKHGVVEALDALFPYILQAFKSLRSQNQASEHANQPEIEKYRHQSPDTPDAHL